MDSNVISQAKRQLSYGNAKMPCPCCGLGFVNIIRYKDTGKLHLICPTCHLEVEE